MENALDLSNDRLSILYVISSYGEPVPYTRLMNAVLQGHFMDYIDFSQLISDLEEDGYLYRYGSNGEVTLILTAKGQEALEALGDLVTQYAVRFAEMYLPAVRHRDTRAAAAYGADDVGRLYVHMTLTDGGVDILDLKVPAYSKKDALDLCGRFEAHSEDIYGDIMAALLKDRADNP